MEKNQNDKSNPSGRTPSEQPSSKSHQEQTQEGKKKTEIDPNNPVANTKYQGSQQDKEKHQESGKSNTHVPDTEENEEEIND